MAQALLAEANRKQTELAKKRAEWRPMRVRCPARVGKLLMRCCDFKTRTKLERVCKEWQQFAQDINRCERRQVWMYMIFRKGHLSGHDRLTVSISSDGPIFWSKLVVYIYCCSCHYNAGHEIGVMGLLRRLSPCVNRLCLVDSPIDYPFLPDQFFWYISNNCPMLQFIYIREIDLERINHRTVERLAEHKVLKKLIVHQCRKIDVLQDFGQLPQLYVVKGEIQGLKALLGDIDLNSPAKPPPLQSYPSPARTAQRSLAGSPCPRKVSSLASDDTTRSSSPSSTSESAASSSNVGEETLSQMAISNGHK